jgi:hypothetical protein
MSTEAKPEEAPAKITANLLDANAPHPNPLNAGTPAVKESQSPDDSHTNQDRRDSVFSGPRGSRRRRSPPVQGAELEVRVLESLQSFLPLIISISVFGASTFASLVSQLSEPEYKFSLDSVRLFMAIAWILFIVALGVAMFGVVVVKPKTRGRAVQSGELRVMVEVARAVKLLCQMLVIVAFMFLSLVVVAYSSPVGWVAVALTGFGLWATIVMWAQWFLIPESSVPELLYCD